MYDQKEEKMNETCVNILMLADDMAAAAVSFSAHGYDTFIRARDTLKEYLMQMKNLSKTA